MRITIGVLLGLLLVWGTLARDDERRSPAVALSALRSSTATPKGARRGESRAESLLDLRASAYSARLFPREGGLLVVTPSLLVEIREDGGAEKHEVDLGRLQVLLGNRVAFVRENGLFTISQEGLQEERRISLPLPPRDLVAAGPRLAWTALDEGGQHVLQTESADRVVTFFESSEELSSPVFHDEAIYFLERRPETWRVGRAPLDGSEATFGAPQTGRIPPRIVAGPDGIYYYDGPERGVRRASFDLSHVEPYAPGTICSPMVVTDRVVCAQVGGLVEVAHASAEPRSLGVEPHGPVSTLAAFRGQAYWVADYGPNRMLVRTAAMPDL